MSDPILERFRDADLDPMRREVVNRPTPPAYRAVELPRAKPPVTLDLRFPAAATAVIAVLILVAVAFNQTETRRPPGVASLLTASEAMAETREPTRVVHSTVIETDVMTVAGNEPYSAYVPTRTEAWVKPDGSGRLFVQPIEPRWAGPRDAARATAAGEDLQQLTGFDPGGRMHDVSAGRMDQLVVGEQLPPTADMPTESGQLLEVLRANQTDADIPDDVRIFELAADLLLKPGASPDLKAAGYEVVAQLDGVTVDEGSKDPRGRPATAASISSDYSGSGITHTLYFDPVSYQPLAYTRTLGAPAPYIDSTELSSKVVVNP